MQLSTRQKVGAHLHATDFTFLVEFYKLYYVFGLYSVICQQKAVPIQVNRMSELHT